MRNHPRLVRPGIAALLAGSAGLFALSGCAKGVEKQFVQNQPPLVRLTHAPAAPTSREAYAYRMNWVGYDPDGRVDHFIYAIDPANLDQPDSLWLPTELNEELFSFTAKDPDLPLNPRNQTASEFHTFAIRAVDEQGMQSPTVYRTFFSYTAAPAVTIESPRPTSDIPILTPSTRIQWSGTDSDGPTLKPVKYRFRLFTKRNPDFPGIDDFLRFATDTATVDDFRDLYAPVFGPTDKCPTCTNWDSSPGDTTEARFTGLIPSQRYLFVVTGFDNAGAYDPLWASNKNMLQFVVGYAGARGPRLTMFNEYFNYTYLVPGWINDPTRYVPIEIPAALPLTINWFAVPPVGATMKRYRWVLDLEDLFDESERRGPDDYFRWSPWSLNETSVTLKPFNINNEVHRFFIEAEDNNDLKSLGIVQFTVVKLTFGQDILFVDDTRLGPDRFSGGVLQVPQGSWPAASELDTFFFAKGGYPWKRYPAGSISPPGIFNGYSFDTLGTRQLTNGVVPLSMLGKFQTVVWYVDAGAPILAGPPGDARAPTASLRYMSSPGQSSTIAIYCRGGGRLWMFGGGAGLASIIPWNRGEVAIYTNPEISTTEGELIPGRFLYDFIHWQQGMLIGTGAEARLIGTEFRGTGPSRGWAGAPNYDQLRQNLIASTSPASVQPVLQRRTVAGGDEPPPPLRTANQDWYVPTYIGETISQLTFIREDINGELPGGEISTLDSIFVSTGGSLGLNKVIMTHYHGPQFPAVGSDRASFVFSGFPLWHFRRAQQIVLADFVLQDIFGHTRQPDPRQPFLNSARASAAQALRQNPRPAAPGRATRSNRE